MTNMELGVCWLVGCLTSLQHASVSQGRICTDNFTCHHTEIVAFCRMTNMELGVCWLVACLTPQQQASVSQGRICTILRAATLRYKLQIKLSTSPSHGDTGLTSPSTDPMMPGAWRNRVSAGTGGPGVSLL